MPAAIGKVHCKPEKCCQEVFTSTIPQNPRPSPSQKASLRPLASHDALNCNPSPRNLSRGGAEVKATQGFGMIRCLSALGSSFLGTSGFIQACFRTCSSCGSGCTVGFHCFGALRLLGFLTSNLLCQCRFSFNLLQVLGFRMFVHHALEIASPTK